ncbi:MAG: hypothetical protein Q9177_005427, partial [Variospora cf. flavescens]
VRQATLILPKTGQRIKRQVTLGYSPRFGFPQSNGNAEERIPLLGWPKTQQKPSDTSRLLLGVLKCSIAYFLGSLATFVPAIATMLGQQDGKHMVATITVYFHPARSQGSMFQAMMLAALAFAYAAFIGSTSMGVSILFGRVLDLITLGHAIVLIVFVGGGLGLVGWIKQRLGDPLVNISCSLTSLAIITVLTKEGAVQAGTFSADKIVQVLKMIVMGVVASTAVSFLIYPVSARVDLRENLIAFTDSLSEVLSVTTQSFLAGSEDELKAPQYRTAMNKYKGLLASMEKNLTEAKYEHFVAGREREYWLEAKLVSCMQRLAQNIGGLKNAATTQFQILAQPGMGLSVGGHQGIATAAKSHVVNEESENEESESALDPVSRSGVCSILTSSDVFSEFILHLGPSIKSLAFTLREILDDLPFGAGPEYHVTLNPKYRLSLEEALKLYNRSREDALSRVYRYTKINEERSVDVEAHFEEIAASCGVFSYALQDFAVEMKYYLNILDDLKLESEERPKGRTWDWLKVWRRSQARKPPMDYEPLNPLDEEADEPRTAPSPWHQRINSIERQKLSRTAALRYRIWKALAIFRRDDTKYAIKVGAGAALYALPSFLRSTRPTYQKFRGEWGLLSYMLVCSMTIGASNTTGYARFFGTCLGAVCAIVSWELSGENPYALAALGWIMSLWTAYVIVVLGKGPLGRFIMLTYNLSALYAYSVSIKDLDDDDDESGISPIISEIAFHRVVAVLSGCLWGLIITRLIWPISARQKLKDGLSLLWLRMGLIWKRPPLECRLHGKTSDAYVDLAEESRLHRFLSQLEKVKDSAASEVDLRSPFPGEAYGRLLSGTGGMLDSFHLMNVMIMKESRVSQGEAAILEATTNERAQLSLRISHLFQVMASSIKLEYALTDALPSIDHSRDRLLTKIFGFRKGDKTAVIASDKDFALLYTYALVTGQLGKAMKDLGSEMDNLFGTLEEDQLKLQ